MPRPAPSRAPGQGRLYAHLSSASSPALRRARLSPRPTSRKHSPTRVESPGAPPRQLQVRTRRDVRGGKKWALFLLSAARGHVRQDIRRRHGLSTRCWPARATSAASAAGDARARILQLLGGRPVRAKAPPSSLRRHGRHAELHAPRGRPGWIGIRFQTRRHEAPSDVSSTSLKDRRPRQQRRWACCATLIHGAYSAMTPRGADRSLMDDFRARHRRGHDHLAARRSTVDSR